MITCRQLIELLDDYLAEELAVADLDAVGEHLKTCPDCTTYVTDYEATIAMSKSAFEDGDSVVANIPDRLVNQILEARKRRP